jgi:hypothetical protein
VAVLVRDTRGMLELARGRDGDALAAFEAGERLAGLLAATHDLVAAARTWVLHALVRLGETERAEQADARRGLPRRRPGWSNEGRRGSGPARHRAAHAGDWCWSAPEAGENP